MNEVTPLPPDHNHEDSLPPTLEKRKRIEPIASGQLSKRLFQMDWIEDWLGSKSYGAPRVFDLYTLMAIMIGFALLFGGMKLIEPLLFDSMPTVLCVVSLYCMLTGLAQMLMWGGERPRLASLAVGPMLWIFLGLTLVLVHRQSFTQVNNSQIFRQFQAMLPAGSFVLCSSVLGILSGYVAGGAVAGVFLIADWIRTKMLPQRVNSAIEDSSMIWADAPHSDSDSSSNDPTSSDSSDPA